MPSHTAIAITEKGVVEAIQVPTNDPGPDQILLKHEFSSLIPFDTYMTDLAYAITEYPVILGFNASGTIAKVGSGVNDLFVGDRVTAFSFVSSAAKGTQEYSVQPRAVCSKVPDDIPLDAAATIPDNLITSFYTIFSQIHLPIPTVFPAATAPPNASAPILIYGASTTSGQYAVQLLHASGYRRIIVTASTKQHEYLRSLGATDTFDYNSPNLVADIKRSLGADANVELAVDCVCTEPSISALSKIIGSTGTVALLLPIKKGNTLTDAKDASDFSMELPKDGPFKEGVTVLGIRTFTYLNDSLMKQELAPKIIPDLLAKGVIKPSRVRLLEGGGFKDRVAQGLDLLRSDQVRGEKVVIKIRA